MELFILLIVLAIFAETTILTLSKNKSIKSQNKRKIYVDTSALIDGRILNIAKTGFISDDLIIPKGVLRELQLLADGKDAEKRARARAGLETVSELERIIYFDVEILGDQKNQNPKVDEQLLSLAKENHGIILTLDYNLIKVANAEKIETLNVNDLAIAIRNEFLPGEKTTIRILEKGANPGQGIGHLPDGTMVVVDNAANKIGEDLFVEFAKFHETSAGKMIFAKISAETPTTHRHYHRQQSDTYSQKKRNTQQNRKR